MDYKLQYQGAGRDGQKNLLGDWFSALSKAGEKKEPVAYLFISGNIAELLRLFDIHLVYPEVNALQCGIKKVAGDMILKAEDVGYSSDVCGYVKNDIGIVLNDMQSPMGKLPKPDLLLCNYAGCAIYVKWFEQISHYFNAPLYILDVPYLRENKPSKADVDYIVAQLKDLIKFCEKLTGKKYDEDKLRETLALSKKAEDYWVKILDSAANIPSPFDAYFEAVFFMAPIYILRGSEECVTYYENAWKEIEERKTYGIGPVPEEKIRIVLEGPPPWPHFRTFWEMFKKWGAVVVGSTYTKVGGIWDFGFRHNPDKPLESIAEYCLNCYTNWNMQMRNDMILSYVKRYKADGVIIHSVKSCRSFSMGQADMREYFSRDVGIPTLFIESDLADPRYFQKAQLQNRLDAFFESILHKKLVKSEM